MECTACGYEHEGYYTEDNKYVTTKGDIPFLEGLRQIQLDKKDKFDKTQEYITTKLYVCPKCGTARIGEKPIL
jgi:rubrerythrin